LYFSTSASSETEIGLAVHLHSPTTETRP
jgi:hypothetical protein